MPYSQIIFKSWLLNADSELYFFFQNKCISSVNFFLVFCCFFKSFFYSCTSMNFEQNKYKWESTLFYQLLKPIWEFRTSFSSRTFNNGFKKMHLLLDNQLCSRFKRSSSSLKPTFSSHYSIDIKRKKRNSKLTLFNEFLRLIWECDLSLSAGAYKNGKKMHWILDNKLDLTPCINSYFPLISKNGNFGNGQSKRMGNNQISQYELLNKKNYLSHIFQYIIVVLQ